MARVVRSKTKTYLQRLIDANQDLEDALRGIGEFSHSQATYKLLDCYFSLARFDLEFKNDYGADANGADPYRLLALHVMLAKKQFDIGDALTAINRNTVQSRLPVLQRLFTNNRAFGDVVSILNTVTDLRVPSKRKTSDNTTTGQQQQRQPLPVGLARFDMSVAGGFDTILGQGRAVQRLKRLVEESTSVRQPLSVILYGPPGTGKTSLALATGREYGLNVYTVAVASLGGRYVGERERNTVEIFEYLEKLDEDVLLFVDEADSFLSASAPGETQQAQYTRAVTAETFERFLRPGANRRRRRVLVMATNFEKRVTEDIRRRSAMILIDLPRTREDMHGIAEFYRRSFRVNMSAARMRRIVDYSLRLRLAPSHVSQIMHRVSTQVLLDMLKRGVVVRQYMYFPKRSGGNAIGQLVEPVYTVAGKVLPGGRPGPKDLVVSVFRSKSKDLKSGRLVKPLSGGGGGGGDDGVHITATAVYPHHDGDVERFFRSYAGFDRLVGEIGADNSTKDPDYTERDDDDDDDDSRRDP